MSDLNSKLKLSIIIVSWNVQALLQKCLESIERFKGDLDLEVIIVDNNSSDDTQNNLNKMLAYFRGRENMQNGFQVIFNDENVGFARGNNIALRQARGDYILFLNPDTEIIGNALQTMISYMENNDCAVVGPKLLNPDGSIQNSVRKFPTLTSQILVLTKLHNFIPQVEPLKAYFQLDFDYNKTQEVDQLMGAALMVSREIIDNINKSKQKTRLVFFLGREIIQVDFFDSKYKRIFEEVDLQYRVKKSGYKIVYLPSVEIIHHKGASFTKTRIFRKQLDFNQGMRRWFLKHKPIWQYFILLLFQPVSWLITLLQLFFSKLGDPVRKKFKKREL